MFEEMPVIFKSVDNRNCHLFGLDECIDEISPQFMIFCKNLTASITEKIEFTH